MRKSKQVHSILPCLMLVLVMMFWTVFTESMADQNAKSMVMAVEKEIGSSNYPFDIEGQKGEEIMNVDTSTMESYFADTKLAAEGNKGEEYLLFVGKAHSENDAQNAVKRLNSYIEGQKVLRNDYLSETGKTMLKNGKTGFSGKWCWAIVLKTDDLNEKAVSAIQDQKSHWVKN